MPIKAFEQQSCPIARTFAFLGERWTILVLREIFLGRRRFDEIQRRLGVATNILSARLATLADAGIVERRPYGSRPDRYEYVPTAKGRELQPVMLELIAWGNRHRFPEGKPARIITHTECGHDVDPVQTCSHCGERLEWGNVQTRLGPGAKRSDREAEARWLAAR